MAKGTCTEDHCDKPEHAKGLCGTHYMRLLRRGTPNPERISLAGTIRSIGNVRKYTIDHGFFDCIDSEEKAYWLGFFTADGCVLNSTKLQINLTAGDADHLRKLNASLSSDYLVAPGHRSPQSGPSVRWIASSAPLVRALDALGVTPRKSATVEPWSGPPALMRHYWRGMVDGDGGFSTYCGGQWRAFLAGSRPCVDAFAAWASHACGSRARPRQNSRSANCWLWMTGGNRMVKTLAAELYGGCCVSLDRKQALADVIISL